MSVNIAIFNIGPIELLIMAAAAVMLFGGDLPATARKAARTVGRLRALASELGREFSAEEQLPKRGDLGIDLKQLAKLDEGPVDTRPDLPGRREDDPLPDPSQGQGEDETLPAWRKNLGSEIPDQGESADQGSGPRFEDQDPASDDEAADGSDDPPRDR